MLILLLFIWFIFNGKITWELTVLGVILCACIYFFMCRFMEYSVKKDLALMRRSGFFLYYVGVLVAEIIKSSMQVLHLVLTDREVVEPIVVSHRTRLKTGLGRAILANSVTLTPGTITISLEGDELIIHCLDKTMAEGMDDLVFEKLLEKMENIGRNTGSINEKAEAEG